MFDAVIMVDWSGGHDRGPTPKKDAIWTCLVDQGQPQAPVYHRNRGVAEAAIVAMLDELHAKGRRVLIGFDLCFAYPKGFAEALTGRDDPFAVWEWFAARVEDTPKADIPHLPMKGTERADHGLSDKRATDGSAFSPWQLGGAGAVGSQVIMGMPMLHRLRQRFGADLSVWPFEAPETPIVMAETYFSLVPDALDLSSHPIKDAAQVAFYAQAFAELDQAGWAAMLDRAPTAEGWVLGLGHEDLLTSAPPLKNDCFALPQGAYWTPVDDALAHLRDSLVPVTGRHTRPVFDAAQYILAEPAKAARSHPPAPNTAVDGFAFAGPIPEGFVHLALLARARGPR